MTVRMNIKSHLVAGNSFVWKLPDQVTRDGAAELPAIFVRKRHSMRKEFAGGNVRVLMKESFSLGKCFCHVVP